MPGVRMTLSPQPLVSFVVPAHNEEATICACLLAIHESAQLTGVTYEIIVVDDACTDATAVVAASLGARVRRVACRQIAAARNAGARIAQGAWLFFVDADTLANPRAVGSAVSAVRERAVGGGCVFDFNPPVPLWARVGHPLLVWLFRRLRVSGGCFLFCTRGAFIRIGGFPERYFAVEDRPFIYRLKRHGRFVVPQARVITSGRRARELSGWQALRLVAQVAFGGPEAFTRRGGVWYEPRA